MNSLTNTKWTAIVNGRKSPSHPIHAITIHGTILEARDGSTIYEALCSIVNELEQRSHELAIHDSAQITIHPKS